MNTKIAENIDLNIAAVARVLQQFNMQDWEAR